MDWNGVLKLKVPLRFQRENGMGQGCQIFLGATFQNGKIYQLTTKHISYGIEMYQITVE
jgi:hypothetical protein